MTRRCPASRPSSGTTDPSRLEPGRAVSSHLQPCRGTPGLAKPSRTVPSRSAPCRTVPHRAVPCSSARSRISHGLETIRPRGDIDFRWRAGPLCDGSDGHEGPAWSRGDDGRVVITTPGAAEWSAGMADRSPASSPPSPVPSAPSAPPSPRAPALPLGPAGARCDPWNIKAEG